MSSKRLGLSEETDEKERGALWLRRSLYVVLLPVSTGKEQNAVPSPCVCARANE